MNHHTAPAAPAAMSSSHASLPGISFTTQTNVAAASTTASAPGNVHARAGTATITMAVPATIHRAFRLAFRTFCALTYSAVSVLAAWVWRTTAES